MQKKKKQIRLPDCCWHCPKKVTANILFVFWDTLDMVFIGLYGGQTSVSINW